MRLSGNVEGDVELNQTSISASRLSKEHNCNKSRMAKDIKLKLHLRNSRDIKLKFSGNVEGDPEHNY